MARGYETHNEFRKILFKMKAHFRFFLSHDNYRYPKYQYFMHLVRILRKFRAKIPLKRRGFRIIIMLLLMMSLTKKREIGIKSVILEK